MFPFLMYGVYFHLYNYNVLVWNIKIMLIPKKYFLFPWEYLRIMQSWWIKQKIYECGNNEGCRNTCTKKLMVYSHFILVFSVNFLWQKIGEHIDAVCLSIHLSVWQSLFIGSFFCCSLNFTTSRIVFDIEEEISLSGGQG